MVWYSSRMSNTGSSSEGFTWLIKCCIRRMALYPPWRVLTLSWWSPVFIFLHGNAGTNPSTAFIQVTTHINAPLFAASVTAPTCFFPFIVMTLTILDRSVVMSVSSTLYSLKRLNLICSIAGSWISKKNKCSFWHKTLYSIFWKFLSFSQRHIGMTFESISKPFFTIIRAFFLQTSEGGYFLLQAERPACGCLKFLVSRP